MDNEYIKEEVYKMVRDLLGDEKYPINDADDLVKDLCITSDDLSFVFVMKLSSKFNVKIPNKEWMKISTVGESVELFCEYVRSRESNSDL